MINLSVAEKYLEAIFLKKQKTKTKCIDFFVLQRTHHCGKVDGHQRVAGQEEVIQPDDVAEI